MPDLNHFSPEWLFQASGKWHTREEERQLPLTSSPRKPTDSQSTTNRLWLIGQLKKPLWGKWINANLLFPSDAAFPDLLPSRTTTPTKHQKDMAMLMRVVVKRPGGHQVGED